MTANEIKTALGLPDSTAHRQIAPRAIRKHCAGGPELLDMKEWATGIVNRSHDRTAKQIASDALIRIADVERAMLAALETAKCLPPRSLCDRQRDRLPREE